MSVQLEKILLSSCKTQKNCWSAKITSHKYFVPHSAYFIRSFINTMIIWDHIQMPNIFHNKTIYNKSKNLNKLQMNRNINKF